MNPESKTTPEKILVAEPPEESSICRLFLEPISVAFSKRRGHARFVILLLLANLFLAYGASCGQFNTNKLFRAISIFC